jgi:predicted RNA-binding protein YlxR (DUF448 family)
MTAPMRTCVGCRKRGPRSDLLRVVLDRAAGAPALAADPAARMPGRGAWLHPEPRCLDIALRRGAFARALRVTGPVLTDGLAAFPGSAAAGETGRPT